MNEAYYHLQLIADVNVSQVKEQNITYVSRIIETNMEMPFLFWTSFTYRIINLTREIFYSWKSSDWCQVNWTELVHTYSDLSV